MRTRIDAGAAEPARIWRAFTRQTLTTAAALSLSVVSTGIAFWLHFNFAAAGFVQLLVVLLVATRAGFLIATAVSLVANLSLDYLFVPPVFQFRVSDTENWIALTVFELSALLVSRLSARAAAQTQLAQKHQHESERLYLFASSLLLMSTDRPAAAQILSILKNYVPFRSAVIFEAVDASVSRHGIEDARLDAATQAAYLQGSEENLAEPGGKVRLLRVGVQPIGALGLTGTDISELTVDALASLVALTLERARSLERESRAEAERQVERLRTTVLDALAHEYKTPLAAIKAVATGLIGSTSLSAEQHEMLQLIDSNVTHLSDLTTRLLQMSHLDKATVRLRLQRIQVDEIVQASIGNMRPALGAHKIRIVEPEGGVPVEADPELITLAVNQLLDNAAKYSPPESAITVTISASAHDVQIAVHNMGPHISPDDSKNIFQRFYRASEASQMAPGTGIGLSIVKRVAEIHHGRAWAVSEEQRGNTFTIALPAVQI